MSICLMHGNERCPFCFKLHDIGSSGGTVTDNAIVGVNYSHYEHLKDKATAHDKLEAKVKDYELVLKLVEIKIMNPEQTSHKWLIAECESVSNKIREVLEKHKEK